MAKPATFETVLASALREGDRIRLQLDGREEIALVDRDARVGDTGVYVRLIEHGTLNLRGFKLDEMVERKVFRP